MSHWLGTQEKTWPRHSTDWAPSVDMSDVSWDAECRIKRRRAKNGANQGTDGRRGTRKGGQEPGRSFVISAKRSVNAHRGQVRKVLTIIHMH